MRSAIILAIVAILASCKSAEPEAEHEVEPIESAPIESTPIESTRGSTRESTSRPSTAPGKPPVGAWVVVDEQRGWFKTASADAERLEARRHPDLGVAEVVAITGEFIEVRTIDGTPESTCADGLEINGLYQLSFFVRVDALHPVLTRPEKIEFDDGTELELAVGAPVTDEGVLVHGLTLPVAIDPAALGWWFPASSVEGSYDPPKGPMQREIELHYGNHAFAAAGPFHRAHERRLVKGEQVLTFVNTCGRFVLRAELDPRKLGNERPPGILGTMVRPPCPAWMAKEGTALHWSTGGEAGVVLTTHQLQHARELDDRVCFEVSDFDVCIEKAKLEREDAVGCKPLDEIDWAGLGPEPPTR